jgi:hypothetical protein
MPVDTVEYSPFKLRAKRDGKANLDFAFPCSIDRIP